MKNKKNIYILLPIVLLIWGAVLYQFFSFATPEINEKEENQSFNLGPLHLKKRDTFAINVNYRDPFLGKMYGPVSKKTYRKTIKKLTEPKEEIVWPQLVYKGIVSDTKNKVKVFMLIINGKTFLMKPGALENEVLLKNGNKDAVQVVYKNEQAVIPLKQ